MAREQPKSRNQGKEQKSIPFSFQLGLLTLSVESEVFNRITKYWLRNHKGNKRVSGICFGKKRDTYIEITECFDFSTDENVTTNGTFYDSDLEIFGIYSNGTVPDETDVSILQKLSRTLKKSIFLIKFIWSEELNEISTTIFENVFDVSKDDCSVSLVWGENLISVQVYTRLPHEILPNKVYNIEDSNKIFYLTFYWSCVIYNTRYEADLTDDQKSNSNKINKEIFKTLPTSFEDPFETIFPKLGKGEESTLLNDFYRLHPKHDYIKMLNKICDKHQIEVRYTFGIPLDGKSRIFCYGDNLNHNFLECDDSTKGSQDDVAFSILETIRVFSAGHTFSKEDLISKKALFDLKMEKDKRYDDYGKLKEMLPAKHDYTKISKL